jgi:hypothetical protein
MEFSQKYENCSHCTTILLNGSSTCRIFPVPQAEIHFERVKIFTTEEIKGNLQRDLKVIVKQAYKDCFENWKN